MTMTEFIRVAAVDDISDPGKLIFEMDDRLLVLFRVGGEFYCLDDVCTHDGGPLGEGRLDGFEIACPRHGARFDVRTGLPKSMPATESTSTHTVKVEGGEVFVKLGSDEASEPTTSAVPANSGAVSAPTSLPVADAGHSCQTTNAAGECSTPTLGANATVCAAEAGPLSEERVREELKRVIDPELFVNIVDLGLVYVVDLQPVDEDKTNVRIEMTLTSPMCPAGPQLIGQSKQFVGQLPRVANVEIKLVMDPPWSPDRMTDAARDQLGIF